MDWDRDLPSWSHPSLSRQVNVRPVTWHVQETGHGPMVLLLHGTGASTHTWRALIPELAKSVRVVAVDLPGHGFTKASAQRMALEPMAEDVARLIAHEAWTPDAIIGHSAGAAIGLAVAHRLSVPRMIGINPALEQFEGVAEWLFPFMAKMLALNPFTANMFSYAANRFQTTQIIRGTGSQISEEGLRYYTRLMQDRAHVNGALQMMAAWSLDAFQRTLPKIDVETHFITGSNDQTISPHVASRAARRMPNASVQELIGLGHLAHE